MKKCYYEFSLSGSLLYPNTPHSCDNERYPKVVTGVPKLKASLLDIFNGLYWRAQFSESGKCAKKGKWCSLRSIRSSTSDLIHPQSATTSATTLRHWLSKWASERVERVCATVCWRLQTAPDTVSFFTSPPPTPQGCLLLLLLLLLVPLSSHHPSPAAKTLPRSSLPQESFLLMQHVVLLLLLPLTFILWTCYSFAKLDNSYFCWLNLCVSFLS